MATRRSYTRKKDGKTVNIVAPSIPPVAPVAGVKYDEYKVHMDLLDPRAIMDIAQVMTFGARKYGDYNWQKGLKWSRMYAALLRHLFQFWSGEDLDSETGLSHLAHAGANIMMLLWHANRRRDLDDRSSTLQAKDSNNP